MAESDFKGASPNAHFLIGEMPAPEQLKRSWWQSTGLSIVVHAIVLGVLIYAATHASDVVRTVTAATEKLDFIFLPKPGPGGGGGGRNDPAPAQRKAEIKAAKPVDPTPVPKPANVPTPELVVPIQTAQAVQTIPGALSAVDLPVTGSGTGSKGTGTGLGNGTGNGVGDGTGGGFGGGAFQPGNGITNPSLIKEVKPNYTGDAMRAKLQGVVEMEAIVLADGSIDPNRIKITRSLDSTFGLDQQAIIAVKQWRFRPGTCGRRDGCGGIPFGQPVPVIVSVELTFTLR